MAENRINPHSFGHIMSYSISYSIRFWLWR